MRINDLGQDLFRLAQDEKIEKIGKRLRVECTWATPDYERMSVIPFTGIERYLAKIENSEYVRIAEFVLKAYPQEVELEKSMFALDRPKGLSRIPQFFFVIGPWRVDPVCHYSFGLVQLMVKQLQPKMAQADLVDIRKCEGEADRSVLKAFTVSIQFEPDIAAGFLHTIQIRIEHFLCNILTTKAKLYT